MKVYIIGSLRNPEVPKLAEYLREYGIEHVFDDWYAAGPEADDKWQEYELDRGHDFVTALDGLAAEHVYEFDKHHLNTSDAVVLMLPAGKSGHLEFGYCIGRGTPGFILLDGQPERFDVMYKFATEVARSKERLLGSLRELQDSVEDSHG